MIDPILNIRKVVELTSVSRSSIYAWIQSGHMPVPFRLGPNRIGWRQSVIEAWLAERECASSEEASS